MTLLEQLEQKVLLERLVIGLEEPVLIKGLGELSAKIDSGNGGYNVIHGTDFHQQGDELMFTTHDSFGHEKKMQAKVIDTIEVNMGGGNIENRPVIELDIKFAGEDYKKIPFSVSDRSTNTNPILISKGFVEKQLEALIDVGKKNISTDGIDVVYGESISLDQGLISGVNKWLKGGDDVNMFAPVTKPIGGAAKLGAKAIGGTLGAGAKAASGLAKGAAATGAALAKGTVATGAALGAGIMGLAWLTPKLAKGLWAVSKMTWKGVVKTINFSKRIIKSFNTITKDDNKAIRTKLPSATQWVGTLTKLNAIKGTVLEDGRKTIQGNAAKLIPIVSFSCQKGEIKSSGALKVATRNTAGKLGGNSFMNQKIYVTGQQQRAQTWKNLISKAKKGVQFIKNNRKTVTDSNDKTEQQEEEVIYKALNEALLILEDDNTNGGNENVGNDGGNTEEQGDEDAETNEAITSFDNLRLFYLWFVSIAGQTKDGLIDKTKRLVRDQKDKNSNIISKAFIREKTYDSYFSKLYQMGQLTPDKVGSIIKAISSQIKKLPDQQKAPMAGMWVLGYSPNPEKPEKREYVFYQQQDCLIYSQYKEAYKLTTQEWNKQFKNILPSIQALENQLRSNKLKLANEIISDKAFNEQKNRSNQFPQLLKTLNEIKEELNKVNDDNGKEQIIQNFSKRLLIAYINQFTLSQLNQTEFGQKIAQVLSKDERFRNIDNVKGLNEIITKNKDIANLFQQEKPSEAQQEWIDNKMNFLKSKGII